MAANVERFRTDLDRLLKLGSTLELSMLREVLGDDEFVKKVGPQLGPGFGNEQISAIAKGLPSFNDGYEAWYSEALVLLRQLLPDRVGNFVGFYERPKGRKDLTNENYVIQDYMKGLTVNYLARRKFTRRPRFLNSGNS